MSTSPKVIAWADSNQLQVLKDASACGAIELVGIGAPDGNEAIELSDALGIPRLDDLRAALISPDHDIAWIAAQDALDADARSAIRTASRPVATSTMPSDSILDVLEEGDLPAHMAPTMREVDGYLAANGALEQLGQVECVHVSMICRTGQSSLLARLYDAMDMVHHLLGNPDEVFAVHAGPHPLQTDTVASTSGHFSVAMRYSNRASATIMVSDHGGDWDRQVLVLGEHGKLMIDDRDSEWIHSDGTWAPRGTLSADAPLGVGGLIAEQLARIVEGIPEPDPPGTGNHVLRLCETARLSCLTGEAERIRAL
ncbi:MAG: hypothetical protein MK095_08255 [Phycisphaerales bacterium]|nr:hypothetical protein [Phycisphaerales bacterium]